MLRCSLQVEIPHLEEHHHHPSCNDLCALYLVVSCVYVKNMYIYIYTPYKYIYTQYRFIFAQKTVWFTIGIVCIHPFTKAAITFPTTAFCLLGTFAPDNGQILARTTIGNLGLYVDTWRQLSMGNSWRDFHDMAPMAAVMEPILGGKSWKHERHPKAMCLCAMHASCSNVLMRLLFRWTQDTTILDPLLLGEAARKS